MTALLVSAIREMLPILRDLVCQTYASHLVRTTLSLLTGRSVGFADNDYNKKQAANQRSKKSKRFKEFQAPMKNLLPAANLTSNSASGEQQLQDQLRRKVPDEFKNLQTEMYSSISKALGDEQEVKEVASHNIGTLVVQVSCRRVPDMSRT